MDCQFIYILTITNIELLWIVYSLTNEQQKAYNKNVIVYINKQAIIIVQYHVTCCDLCVWTIGPADMFFINYWQYMSVLFVKLWSTGKSLKL
jgi:hypothetical protein